MTTMDPDIKTALVTGASKGLGKAIAIQLAQNGMRIAVNYNSSAEAAEEVVSHIKDLGANAFAFKADVSKVDEVNGMVSKIEDTFNLFERKMITKRAFYPHVCVKRVIYFCVLSREVNLLGGE